MTHLIFAIISKKKWTQRKSVADMLLAKLQNDWARKKSWVIEFSRNVGLEGVSEDFSLLQIPPVDLYQYGICHYCDVVLHVDTLLGNNPRLQSFINTYEKLNCLQNQSSLVLFCLCAHYQAWSHRHQMLVLKFECNLLHILENGTHLCDVDK